MKNFNEYIAETTLTEAKIDDKKVIDAVHQMAAAAQVLRAAFDDVSDEGLARWNRLDDTFSSFQHSITLSKVVVMLCRFGRLVR